MTRTSKERISRAFKADFPEFVERATALDARISLSPGGRRRGARVYWLDGYRQLTGYLTRQDGSPFTDEDAARNIDQALTAIEEDRRAIAAMTMDERFARVMAQFREMGVQYRMIGEVRFPGGDCGHVFFNAEFDGEVRLHGIGTVARSRAEWRRDEGQGTQKQRFIDLLEADYARHRAAAVPEEQFVYINNIDGPI